MSEELTRAKRSCKVVGKAASIMGGLLLILLVMNVVALGMLMMAKDEFIMVRPLPNGQVLVSLMNWGWFNMNIPPQWLDAIGPRQLLIYSAAGCAFIVGLIVASMLFLSQLFHEIAEGEGPFCQAAVRSLRHMSIAVLLIAPAQWLGTLLFSQLVNLSFKGFNLSMGPSTYFYWLVPLLGAVLFCLSLAFQYGAELQRQSDETL